MPASLGGVGQGGEGTGERWLRYAQRHRWMLSAIRVLGSPDHPHTLPQYRIGAQGGARLCLVWSAGSTPAEETQG